MRAASLALLLALAGCWCPNTAKAQPAPEVEARATHRDGSPWKLYLYSTERWCSHTERYAPAHRGQDAVAVSVENGTSMRGCWMDSGRAVGATVTFYGSVATFPWVMFYQPGSRE